jgi:MOSC domain-containing protein YiiM
VLGLDLDPTVLELAAQEVDGAGNVTFRQGGVRTLQGAGYDVVYARFLLIHMADVDHPGGPDRTLVGDAREHLDRLPSMERTPASRPE